MEPLLSVLCSHFSLIILPHCSQIYYLQFIVYLMYLGLYDTDCRSGNVQTYNSHSFKDGMCL
jgi:hypothetical protein